MKISNVSAVAGLPHQYDQTEYNGGSGENSPSDQIYYVRPGFPDLADEATRHPRLAVK